MLQDGTKSTAGVREGDVLAGKYRVERVLGIGGMGVVVAAHHLQLDEKVALKFLLPDALSNSEAVARFAREARAAVKIKSEHVARVIDVGQLENGAPYMVMEYLDGGDLAAWLLDRGPLPIEQAVEFVLQACEAIAEAHALGIVHRDLKPANLFCIRRADGRLSVKVLDFGISKMTQFGISGFSALTHDAALIGSPLYMSPEQMKSANTVDSLTDIWALGIILFELLTGELPFRAESLPEQVHRVTAEPPSSLRRIRNEIPEALENVILRCLEKDRSKRYRNVAELGVALFPFAPTRARGSVDRISGIIQASALLASVTALPTSPRDSGTLLSAGTLPPLGRTTSDSTGRKAAVVGGGAFAVIILLAIVGLAMWKRASPHAEDSQPPTVASASAAASLHAPEVDPEIALATRPPFPALTATAPRSVAASSAVPPEASARPPSTVAAKPIFSPPPSPRAVPAQATPIAAGPSPIPNANCDPSYYYDADGNKHFKPECFGH